MKAGFAQMMFTRIAFVDVVQAMVNASSESHAEEIRSITYPKLATFERFVEAFAPSKSAAAVGAMVFDQDLVYAEADDGESGPLGVGSAAEMAFDDFRQGLSTTGKIVENLFMQTHSELLRMNFLILQTQRPGAPRFAFRGRNSSQAAKIN